MGETPKFYEIQDFQVFRRVFAELDRSDGNLDGRITKNKTQNPAARAAVDQYDVDGKPKHLELWEVMVVSNLFQAKNGLAPFFSQQLITTIRQSYRKGSSPFKKLPLFPKEVSSSPKYPPLLNRELKDQGLEWKEDPSGFPNIPETDLGEVIFNDPKRYGVTQGSHVPQDWAAYNDAIYQARAAVERKRQISVNANVELWHPYDTPTRLHMCDISQAEGEWIQNVREPLRKLAHQAHAAELNFHYQENDRFMAEQGTAADRTSYHWTLKGPLISAALNEYLPKRAHDLTDYANVFPYFDEGPRNITKDALYPVDFTKEELDAIQSRFNKHHPIRQVWTVVERASASEIAEKEGSLNNQDTLALEKGTDQQAVKWLVKVPKKEGGFYFYVVTNIALHPRFKEYYQGMAKVLEENADVKGNDGSALHPEFKKYTLDVATYLRTGNFPALLEADHGQTQGGLYFSVFKHEGYDVGDKYPLSLTIAIRDPKLSRAMEKFGYVRDVIETEVREAAKSLGLKIETGTKVATKDVPLFMWFVVVAGFFRAAAWGVRGSDYPKREYLDTRGKPFKQHRTLVYLDTTTSWKRFSYLQIIKDLCAPTFWGPLLVFKEDSISTLMHETAHGLLGNREDTPRTTRKTFKEDYGKHWGVLAEPLADLMAVRAFEEMFKRGDITKDQLKGAYAWFAYGTISKFKIRKKVNEKFEEQSPHALGGTMALGWLIKEGVITIKKQFDVDFDKIGPSLEKLRLKLLEFAFKGEPKDYIQFVKDYANQIPDKAEEKIVNVSARRAVFSPMNWGSFRPVKFPVCNK